MFECLVKCLAKRVGQERLKAALRDIQTYDPTQYKGQANPFLHWIYAKTSREIQAMSSCLQRKGVSWEDLTWRRGSTWSDRDIRAMFECLLEVMVKGGEDEDREDEGKLVKFAFGIIYQILDTDPYVLFHYEGDHGEIRDIAFNGAKDVVADKIEDAFRSIRTYDPTRYRGERDPFLNWIYTIICREATRFARRFAHEVQGPNVPPPLPPPLPPPQPNDPWKLIWNGLHDYATKKRTTPEPGSIWEAIWKVIEDYLPSLSETYQGALLLFYREGLSIAEAADRVDCSVGAMKVRLHRARQEIRDRVPLEEIRRLYSADQDQDEIGGEDDEHDLES